MWIWKYPSLNYGLWINAIFDSQNEKNLRNTKYVGIPVIKKKDYDKSYRIDDKISKPIPLSEINIILCLPFFPSSIAGLA